MAGDVDDFADEEKTGDQERFHGFAGEFARVDTASGDFGFLVAFRGGGRKLPGVELRFESSEGGIGVVGRSMKLKPTRGETIGEKFLEGFADKVKIAARGSAERGGSIAQRREIETDGPALFPVGRNLEDRGAAESTVGEKHFFAK